MNHAIRPLDFPRNAVTALFLFTACSSPPAGDMQAFSLQIAPMIPVAETFVLDIAGDFRIVGESDPVEADADPPFAVRARLEKGGGEVPWSLARRALCDARLLRDGRVVALTPEGEVLLADREVGPITTLDRDAVGPIGASVDGRHLVYVKGEAPEMEVVAFDRVTGRARTVVTNMGACWSPAISDDGQRVVFASSHSGVPALWLRDGEAEPRQLTNVDLTTEAGTEPELSPTPDGPAPVLFTGSQVVFATPAGVFVVALSGRVVDTIAKGQSPHWLRGGSVFGVLVDGRVVSRSLAGAAR